MVRRSDGQRGWLIVLIIVALCVGAVGGFIMGRLSFSLLPVAVKTPTVSPVVLAASPTSGVTASPTALTTPTPSVAANATETPTPATPAATETETPTEVPTGTPTSTPTVTPTPGPPTATPTNTPTPTLTPTPTPTRGPLRITKLGLGVYGSGGAYESDMARWRPSVILLMDPTVDFAKAIHALYPKAFIIGRRYVANQPLDNATARGTAFADYVAQLAVPLKGVVNAWVSYNEVSGYTGPTDNNYVAWNDFQVAFAQRLQGAYGVDAVAGDDAPGAVSISDYVKYFAGAIRASHYFGVHAYPQQGVIMRTPAGEAAMLRYRNIHDALTAAGIQSGPFILTETGLFQGWRGVESEQDAAADWIWLSEELNKDPYVIGQTVFGLFDPNNAQWRNFNVAGTSIEDIVGHYNSCEPNNPCPPGQQGG